MKQFSLLLLNTILTIGLIAQGVTKNGQHTSTSAGFVDKNGRLGASAVLDKNGKLITGVATGLTINHIAGTVAPVTKTVTYGTVTTGISGASKTWITQNLGASNQATSVTDATEPSAGWYFQFNRKQGYKNDGTTRTPGSAWTTSINESADWSSANDPCTIELGTGWRIPTNSEWTAVNTGGSWTTYDNAYSSVLKMHASGYLQNTDGARVMGCACEWSSTQSTSSNGNYIGVLNNSSAMYAGTKAYAFPLRCIKDSFPVINHIAGTVAPVTKTVTYGTVTTSLSGSSKIWITQNLGATNQASSATDATEPSAGWYFQFNRKQGYKHDGTTLTPAWTVTSINESSDWTGTNDPCTSELGAGWRIPTATEWASVDANGSWNSYTDAYSSVLKMHTAGFLAFSDGSRNNMTSGYYWTSSQSAATTGTLLSITAGGSSVTGNTGNKANAYPVRCIKDDVLTINHTAGTVAPVTKTVTYSLVTTTLSGASKIWIAQNLGASNQAASATDGTEAAAGWYFQFNRKQGYKHDGSARTPNNAWVNSISENSDWVAANDPCTIELGTGWRIPTGTEWSAADANGGWNNYNDSYNSVLKIHSANFLQYTAGGLGGGTGNYWSSTQASVSQGRFLGMTAGINAIYDDTKAYGFSIRCIKD